MPHSAPELTELSDAERGSLEAWLLEFDQFWTPDSLSRCAAHMPAASEPVRRALLAELVKIDLERCWGTGERRVLDAYLRQFPELGTSESVSPGLVQAEYEVRRQSGEEPSLEEYRQRFPVQAADLQRLIDAGQTPLDRRSALCETSDGGELMRSAPMFQPRPIGPLPRQFGRYRILRLLGEGAMGAVYLADDTLLNRPVALKMPGFSESHAAEMVERFYREARAAAQLRHANICPVYDVGEIEGTHYIAMAYIDGRPLSQFVSEGNSLPVSAAAAVVRSLALALEHAHAHGVVHRDLKPANIMIDRQHEPLITDFGLARQIDQQRDVRVTRHGIVLGTPAYLSPEQVLAESDAVSPASDIYSLGVLLYELLTGRLPFRGPVSAVLSRIPTEEPARPSMHRPDLDAGLEAICLKMMAKRIEDRYGSMRDVAAALTTFLEQRPGEFREHHTASLLNATSDTHHDQPSPPVVLDPTEEWIGPQTVIHEPPPRLTGSRKRIAGIAAAAVVLCLGLSLVFRPIGAKQELPLENAAIVAEQPKQPVEQVWQLPGPGSAFTPLVLSADGRRILAGSPNGFVRLLDFETGRELWQVRAHPHAVRALAFSPDGTRAVFAGSGNTAHVWDLDSGEQLLTLTLDSPEEFGCVTFSPDGRWIVTGDGSSGFRNLDKQVRLWDARTGKEDRRFEGHERPIRSLLFTPNGRHLISSDSGLHNPIRMWDVQAGRTVRSFSFELHSQPPVALALSDDAQRLFAVSSKGTIATWQLETGLLLQTECECYGKIGAAAFSPDLRYLAYGDDTVDIRVLDLKTGRELPRLKGHRGRASSLVFTRDGGHLVSVASDNAIRLWPWPPAEE